MSYDLQQNNLFLLWISQWEFQSPNRAFASFLQEQFEKHLVMLKQLDWCHCWSDRDIIPGADRKSAITEYLRDADLLLLFVGADFLNSEYGAESVIQEIVRRQRECEAVVIPVLLRPVEWKKTALGLLQALPRIEKHCCKVSASIAALQKQDSQPVCERFPLKR